MSKDYFFSIAVTVADQRFSVLELQGKEALSSPFYFKIAILSKENLSQQLLLQNAKLLLSPNRIISGVITNVSLTPWNDDQYKLLLIFEPKLKLLSYSYQIRVFLDQSIVDILRSLAEEAGYLTSQLQFSLTNNYANKSYTLQVPGENSLDFLMRLAAKTGLFFWHDVDTNQQEILCFADNNLHCNYLFDKISYIAPSGLYPYKENCTTPRGFFSLQQISQSTPNVIHVSDHNEMQPNTSLTAQQPLSKNNSPYKMHKTFYGKNSLTPATTTELAKLFATSQQANATRLSGKSNVPEMAPGKSLQLDAKEFSQNFSGDYLVVAVTHAVAQNIEQQGSEIAYQNEVELLTRAIIFRQKIPDHPKVPTLFHARVESNYANAFLDEHGRYRLRHHFDQSTALSTNASPPLLRIQPYGGSINDSHNPHVGFHTPLLDGAEILVGCLHGDPDRPIIYNTSPNNKQISPVTAANATQHRFVSSGQHELLMDDVTDKEKIQLKTANALNLLEMNAQRDNHQLTVTSQQGAMLWQAGKNIEIQNDGSAQEIIGKEQINTVKQNYQLKTQTKDLQQQAASDQQLIAQQNMVHFAHENLAIENQQNLILQSQKHFNITATGDHALLQVDNGQALLQSRSNINIFANGDGVIEFSQGAAGWQLTPAGIINFFGNNICNISSNPINFKGKVNYIDGAGSSVTPHTLPTP